MDKHKQLIEALKKERAGYANRGLHERVAQVDEVLASLGVRELASLEPASEVAALLKGKKRRSR